MERRGDAVRTPLHVCTPNGPFPDPGNAPACEESGTIRVSIRKHTIYNLAGAFVPMAVSVVSVPLYLRVIGTERYGIMSLFWVMLGYFGLFDLGLGRSVSQRLAALHDQSDAQRSEVFWTGLFVSLAVGAIGAALLVPISLFVLHLVKLDASKISAEINTAAPLLAVTLPIALISGLFSGALAGRERFGIVNLIEATTNVLLVAVPIGFALAFGANLAYLIAASLLIRIGSTLVMFFACRRAVPLLRPTRPTRTVVKSLLGYGGWVTVQSTVGSAIAMWDRFVIGAVLGATAVSIYVIPTNVVQRLLVLPSALVKALFPRLTRANDVDARQLTAESMSGLGLLATLPTIALIACSYPLMTLWIGHDLAAQSAPVAQILLPAVYANSFGLILFFFLQARNRPDITAKLHLAELLPYAALLYLLMRTHGVAGAAMAWSIRTIIDAALLAWLAGIGWPALLRVLPLFGLVVGSAVAALTLNVETAMFWSMQAILAILASYLSIRLAPPRAHELVTARLAMLRRRLAR
jgi:O-antigen/teichoic acid export membrane protein